MKSAFAKLSIIGILTGAGLVLALLRDTSDLFTAFSKEDLKMVTDFSALDGHPILRDQVYPGGFKFDFVFSHDLQGQRSILITELNFVASVTDPVFQCDYRIDAGKIGGSGAVTSARTVTVLQTDRATLGQWRIDNKKRASKGPNLLNTEPPMSLKIAPNDDTDRVVGVFMERATGLSSIRLEVVYVVDGQRFTKNAGELHVCN